MEGEASLPLLENHYMTELQKIPGLGEPQIYQYRPVGRTGLQFVSQWVDSAQLPPPSSSLTWDSQGPAP